MGRQENSYAENCSYVYSDKRQQRVLQSMAGKGEATAKVSKLDPCVQKQVDLPQKSKECMDPVSLH